MQNHREFLSEIIGDKWEQPVYAAASICPFDLFVLTKYAEYLGAKKITEFGCGATTLELRRKNFDVSTFALDICIPIKQQKIGVDFIKCNIMDPQRLPELLESCTGSDLLVIDSCHSFDMAKYYHENILMKLNVPIWIHDFVSRAQRTGEQQYLDKYVINKTHRVLTMTDLPVGDLEAVGKKVGTNIVVQKNRANGPKVCAVILERI